MAAEQQTTESRRGREGGRWINERPTSEEFASWFTTSMKLDPALHHEDYVGGVVLIPAVDSKAPYVIGFSSAGVPIIEHRDELSYIPYAKVESRIAYWWDLLEVHPEWLGVVQHEITPRLPVEGGADSVSTTTEEPGEGGTKVITVEAPRNYGAMAQMVHQLPEGFSVMSVPVGSGYSHFVCCTIRVSVYDREKVEAAPGDTLHEKIWTLAPLRTGRGTKQVPLLAGRSTPYADPNSLMKAETGAHGRALGFAGIFVIPGSGVATAEDMFEAMTQGTPPAEAAPANDGPGAPEVAPVRTGAEQAQQDDEQLRARAVALYQALSEQSPGKAEEFGQWARARRLASLGDAKGPVLRGVVKTLERLSNEAEQQQPSEEMADVPAQAGAERGSEAS